MILPQKKSLSSFAFHLALLSIFILISFWTYRSGIVALPRSDHQGFMGEREYAKSDWDFFVKELSFNRTRVIAKGDSYLFRPGTTGTLAILDIFFRHNLYAIGIFSILTHALVVFSLYLLICRFSPRWLAFLLATIFETHLAGMEMVFWRHISPYMFSLFFFGLGLYFLSLWREQLVGHKLLWLASACFFFSCLFHEVMLMVLIASGFLFLFWRFLLKFNNANQDQSNLHLPHLIAACLLPILISALPNFFTFFHYSTHFQLDMNSRAVLQNIDLTKIILNLTFVAGLLLTAFLIPSLIRFSFSNLEYRAEWNFLEIPSVFFYIVGVVFLFIFFIFLAAVLLRKQKWTFEHRFLICAFASVCFSCIFFGLTFGRAIPRSISYLQNSTYYFYMTNYALTILIAWLFTVILERFSSRNAKYVTICTITVFSIYQISAGVMGIENTLKVRRESDKEAAQKTLQVWSELKKHPDYCYGGTTSRAISKYTPNMLLYRQSCNAKPDSIPLYMIEQPGKGFWLARLKTVSMDAHSLKYGKYAAGRGIIFSSKATTERIDASGFVASEMPYHPILLQVNIHGGFIGGLLVGCKDMNNFSVLVANQRYFYGQINKDGAHSDPLDVAQQILDPELFTLSLKKIGSQYIVFYNQMLLSVLDGVPIADGKVGLYRNQKGSPNEYFSDFILSDATESGLEQFGEFEPIYPFKI